MASLTGPGLKLPDFLYGPAIGTIIAAEGSAIFEPLIESGKVNELADQKQIAGLKAGLEIAAKDYLKAMRVRTLVQKELRKLLSQVDVLLAPNRFGPASKISDPLDRRPSDRPAPKVQGLGALIPAGIWPACRPSRCPAASPITFRSRFS